LIIAILGRRISGTPYVDALIVAGAVEAHRSEATLALQFVSGIYEQRISGLPDGSRDCAYVLVVALDYHATIIRRTYETILTIRGHDR
jgi:hypothetical protein